ncbi:MAG TPA: CHAD domain-containing protein [Planctomycetota bacterium]|nr:CHAD domain-containing protein [Planctomycetota bacterium]
MAVSSERVAGVSSNQTYRQAAQRVLRASLSEVMHWLPRAVLEGGGKDDEVVHRLRVASRRAVQAVRVFSDLIGERKAERLRQQLREIRKAADDARNYDVLLAQFESSGNGTADSIRAKIAERIRAGRRDVQRPMAAVYQHLTKAHFNQEIREVLSHLGAKQKLLAERLFGAHAPLRLSPVVKKFFKAARGKISDDGELHRLRIEAKKLRYTIEIVASAFGPDFSDKLYRKLCEYQDVMGAIRDHTMARDLFQTLLNETADPVEHAYIEGMLFSEDRARTDLIKSFEALWTRKAIARLERQFELYCGGSR